MPRSAFFSKQLLATPSTSLASVAGGVQTVPVSTLWPLNRGIKFPSSRKSLWDRTPLGRAEVVEPKDNLPVVSIPSDLHHRLSQLSHAVALASCPSGRWVHVSLQSTASHTIPSEDVLQVPVAASLAGAASSNAAAEQEECLSGLASALQHGLDRRGAARLTTGLELSLRLSLSHAPGRGGHAGGGGGGGGVGVGGVTATLTATLLLPAAALTLTPLYGKRLCEVPLTQSLSSVASESLSSQLQQGGRQQQQQQLQPAGAAAAAGEGGGGVQSGYLTMDQARSLLPLAADDPNVYSVPLVGVWVRGAKGPEHPLVYGAALKFAYGSALPDRATQPDGAFLLLLSSGDSPVARCYEARFSDPAGQIQNHQQHHPQQQEQQHTQQHQQQQHTNSAWGGAGGGSGSCGGGGLRLLPYTVWAELVGQTSAPLELKPVLDSTAAAAGRRQLTLAPPSLVPGRTVMGRSAAAAGGQAAAAYGVNGGGGGGVVEQGRGGGGGGGGDAAALSYGEYCDGGPPLYGGPQLRGSGSKLMTSPSKAMKILKQGSSGSGAAQGLPNAYEGHPLGGPRAFPAAGGGLPPRESPPPLTHNSSAAPAPFRPLLEYGQRHAAGFGASGAPDVSDSGTEHDDRHRDPRRQHYASSSAAARGAAPRDLCASLESVGGVMRTPGAGVGRELRQGQGNGGGLGSLAGTTEPQQPQSHLNFIHSNYQQKQQQQQQQHYYQQKEQRQPHQHQEDDGELQRDHHYDRDYHAGTFDGGNDGFMSQSLGDWLHASAAAAAALPPAHLREHHAATTSRRHLTPPSVVAATATNAPNAWANFATVSADAGSATAVPHAATTTTVAAAAAGASSWRIQGLRIPLDVVAGGSAERYGVGGGRGGGGAATGVQQQEQQGSLPLHQQQHYSLQASPVTAASAEEKGKAEQDGDGALPSDPALLRREVVGLRRQVRALQAQLMRLALPPQQQWPSTWGAAASHLETRGITRGADAATATAVAPATAIPRGHGAGGGGSPGGGQYTERDAAGGVASTAAAAAPPPQRTPPLVPSLQLPLPPSAVSAAAVAAAAAAEDRAERVSMSGTSERGSVYSMASMHSSLNSYQSYQCHSYSQVGNGGGGAAAAGGAAALPAPAPVPPAVAVAPVRDDRTVAGDAGPASGLVAGETTTTAAPGQYAHFTAADGRGGGRGGRGSDALAGTRPDASAAAAAGASSSTRAAAAATRGPEGAGYGPAGVHVAAVGAGLDSGRATPPAPHVAGMYGCGVGGGAIGSGGAWGRRVVGNSGGRRGARRARRSSGSTSTSSSSDGDQDEDSVASEHVDAAGAHHPTGTLQHVSGRSPADIHSWARAGPSLSVPLPSSPAQLLRQEQEQQQGGQYPQRQEQQRQGGGAPVVAGGQGRQSSVPGNTMVVVGAAGALGGGVLSDCGSGGGGGGDGAVCRVQYVPLEEDSDSSDGEMEAALMAKYGIRHC